MAYVVSACTERGDETREVHTAALAQNCVDEFRKCGAQVVTIRKDGAYLAEAYLLLLMAEEAVTPEV